MLAVALAAIVAAVLIVTLSGGGHARHARAPAGAGQSETQVAASYLGLAPGTVRHRLRSGETLAEVAESTTGHSSRGLLRKLLAYRAAELSKQGLTPAEVHEREARMRAQLESQLRRTRRVGAALAPASRYLGVTEAQLRAQLRSGRTLAQVAAAHGRSRSELIAGILRLRRARLQAARRGGQITAAEERSAIVLLRRRIARAVDAKTGQR
jgi:hypothetical protein